MPFRINTVHENAERHLSAKNLKLNNPSTSEDYELFNVGSASQTQPAPRKGNCIRQTKSAQADYF